MQHVNYQVGGTRPESMVCLAPSALSYCSHVFERDRSRLRALGSGIFCVDICGI